MKPINKDKISKLIKAERVQDPAKEKTITFRLEIKDYRLLKKTARENHLSTSAFMRSLILGYIKD
jgi:uncharacterized protein (DUF1778 family)